MAEIADVLTKLLERTNEGKVAWKPTADEQTFVAVIGDNSVLVSSPKTPISVAIILRILDKNGRELERVDSVPVGVGLTANGGNIPTELRQLYEKARSVALSVPSELDELLQELERI